MSSDWLAEAGAIGRELAATAIWHDGRCNWVGAIGEPWKPEHRALDATVYRGTAGVGLALAHVALATGDEPLSRTALGALRHAASARTPSDDGFHAGPAGVACALVRGAELLHAEELAAAAPRFADAARSARPRCCPDLVTGAAGALQGLLWLGRLEDAVACGEQLLAAAHVDAYGWSWPAGGGRRMCGVSHGVAGIGWALADLHDSTGDARFREAAAGAFAFERSWLDPRTGTWPDLRIPGQRRTGPRIVPEHSVATWCHGEAGIALSRLHASLGPDTDNDARIALAAIERFATPEADDLTLCHGLGGAIDVLLEAGRPHRSTAHELANSALHRNAPNPGWPCGALGEQPPGLYRGLAGIAWLMLRLHDAATPSPLVAIDGGVRRA